MSDEARQLHEKAARCRRLAVRASRTGKAGLSDRLLRRAAELDRLAAAAGRPDPGGDGPVHPFLGRAPGSGAAGGAATLDDEA